MSRGQPHTSQADQSSQVEPVKYGDDFNVSGELASKPISPQEAADVQNVRLRTNRARRPSRSIAMRCCNQRRAGLVSHGETTDFAKDQGVTNTETNVGGGRSIITEGVGGQILGQHAVTDAPMVPTHLGSAAIDGVLITIEEAHEAVAISAGDKPVDHRDAAAITAAKFRATGKNQTRGGVGDAAHSAATHNTPGMRREDMTKLSDVLIDATEKLATDMRRR